MKDRAVSLSEYELAPFGRFYSLNQAIALAAPSVTAN